MKNLLLKSENIKGLKYLINEMGLTGKIDLVYIDPPFATNNVFTISDSRSSTISNVRNGDIAYKDKLIGSNFIEFLKERLIIIRELLSDKGSIYLHIDYKIGHYVKVMMDEVFGIENFRNDITRIKCNPKNFKRTGYGNIKDLILFYSKASKPIWHEPYEKHDELDLIKRYPKIDKQGRRYATVPLHAPGETINGKSNQPFRGQLPPIGRHWRTNVETIEEWDKNGLIEWSSTGNPRKKIFADESKGKRVQDIWDFKDPQYPNYPTEKNSEMIDMIIKTSSDPSSIVLDCFCGSGSTLLSAHKLGRSWIGIDESELAISASQKKLRNFNIDLFTDKPVYEYIEL